MLAKPAFMMRGGGTCWGNLFGLGRWELKCRKPLTREILMVVMGGGEEQGTEGLGITQASIVLSCLLVFLGK